MTEFVTPKPVKQSRPPVICSVIFHTVNHGTLSFPDIHSLLFHFPVFPNSLRLEFGQNINKMYSPDVQNYSAFFRFHFRFQENAQHQWAQLKKKKFFYHINISTRVCCFFLPSVLYSYLQYYIIVPSSSSSPVYGGWVYPALRAPSPRCRLLRTPGYETSQTSGKGVGWGRRAGRRRGVGWDRRMRRERGGRKALNVKR